MQVGFMTPRFGASAEIALQLDLRVRWKRAPVAPVCWKCGSVGLGAAGNDLQLELGA